MTRMMCYASSTSLIHPVSVPRSPRGTQVLSAPPPSPASLSRTPSTSRNTRIRFLKYQIVTLHEFYSKFLLHQLNVCLVQTCQENSIFIFLSQVCLKSVSGVYLSARDSRGISKLVLI